MPDKPINTIHATLEQARNGIRVRGGHRNVIILDVPEVDVNVVEAEDFLFRFDSALMQPCALEEVADQEDEDDDAMFEVEKDGREDQTEVSGLSVVKGVFRFLYLCRERGDKKRILITGHTDTKGKESYNKTLSEQRAQVVTYVMLGDEESRNKFVDIVQNKHNYEDLQHLLLWISKAFGWSNVNPGKVDGEEGPKTREAIRRFKQNMKWMFPPARYRDVDFPADIQGFIDQLGTWHRIGPEFWHIIFELYQAEVRAALAQDGLSLAALQSQLRWVDAEKKAVGCGETWPIDKRGQDNYKSQANRRVEILFYDPREIEAGLPCKSDKGEEKDGSKCVEKDCHIYRDIDRYNEKEHPFDPRLHWKYIELDDDGQLSGILTLLVCDYEYQPLRKKRYSLRFEGEAETSAVTTPEGLVLAVSPPDGTKGELEVFPDDNSDEESIIWELRIGDVPAPEDPRGASIRLQNLGYFYGEPTDSMNEELSEAIECFQYGGEDVDSNGELDQPTCARLCEVHDDMA